MARRTQQQRREGTRRSLLESAARVFGDKGFNGATIEEISDHADLSRGAFYAHFENKDELFFAVLDEMVQDVQTFSAQPLGGHGPTALVDAMRDVQVGHSRVDPAWFRLYAEYRAHALRDPETRKRLAQHYRRLREVVTKAIENQFAELDVALPMPADELAAMVVALDEGLAIQRGVDARAIRPDLLLDLLHRLIHASAALDH